MLRSVRGSDREGGQPGQGSFAWVSVARSDSFFVGSSSDRANHITVCRQQCAMVVTVAGQSATEDCCFGCLPQPDAFVLLLIGVYKKSLKQTAPSSAASSSLSPRPSCTYGHNSSLSLGPSSLVVPQTLSSEPHVKVRFILSWIVNPLIITFFL